VHTVPGQKHEFTSLAIIRLFFILQNKKSCFKIGRY